MVDIWFYGQACFKVKGRSASLVFDPYDASFTGLSPLKLEADIVCVSHDHADHNHVESVRGPEGSLPFVISAPGEYEISSVNIVGIGSFHDEHEGKEQGKNIIYQAIVDEVNIVHLGDLGQKKLTQAQVEEISACDVLLIPVGGVYTINAKDAPDIIAQLEPRIIVPMHYFLPHLKFNLDPVDKFLSSYGKEKVEPQSKLSLSKERLPEESEIVILAKS